MSIKKTENGWLVNEQPGGRKGKQVKRTFKTKREAERFKSYIWECYEAEKPWNPDLEDVRRLNDLIQDWYRLHGLNLKDGNKRKRVLELLSDSLGNPIASTLTPIQYIEYRNECINSGITITTVNKRLAYLKAVYNQLIKLGQNIENPLSNLSMIKQDEPELTYLRSDEIETLLIELKNSRNPDAYKVAVLSLVTGGRWSEVERLRLKDILPGKIQFPKTKSRKLRAVPVEQSILDEVIPKNKPCRLFCGCYSAFRSGLKRTGIELPKGQMAHVLRHTFASHFVMNGGNILVLQRVLGHSDIKLTMRYAHLAQEHLEEALKFNPLSSLKDL